MSDADVVDRVAWAIHCWTCPLCWENGTQAMAESGQDHVTSDDRLMASFLIGALGLTPADPSTRRRMEVVEPACVCTIGAQLCDVHPGNLRTKEEKIAFRKAWDARVVES